MTEDLVFFRGKKTHLVNPGNWVEMKHDFSFFLILHLFYGLPRMSYCLRTNCSKLYKNGEALLKYEQAQMEIKSRCVAMNALVSL